MEEGLPKHSPAAPPMTKNPILCSFIPLLIEFQLMAAQPAVGFSNTRKETFRQSRCHVAG